MNNEPLMVRVEHARALGYCSRGMRAFAARHGLDWGRFVHEGIPAEELEATGDHMALQVVEKARGRQI